MLKEKKYYDLYSPYMEHAYMPTKPQSNDKNQNRIISLSIIQLLFLIATLFIGLHFIIFLGFEFAWGFYIYKSIYPSYKLRKNYLSQEKKINNLDKKRDSGQNYSLLFFYGTLKSNFHWNYKYLSRAHFIGKAITNDSFPLVVGECGVPYLLGNLDKGIGHQIIGEVWYVRDDNLKGLDEYEGLSKGYYDRISISVKMLKCNPSPLSLEEKESIDAFVYVKKESSPELRAKEYLSEYLIDYHREYYRPIEHILVKQEMYLLGNPNKRD